MSKENPSPGDGMRRLNPDMSVQEFNDGYFYAVEVKRFAQELGIPVGSRRKFELEQLVRERLATGRAATGTPVLPRNVDGSRDSLASDAVVKNYVGSKETKVFLRNLVHAEVPGLRDKSGQWCLLNDWRRQRQEARVRFTYHDLAARLRELMGTKGRLPQVPSAQMNNFITDYRADPGRLASGVG